MHYFAYGSNMSIARLTARVPSATPIGIYSLAQHDLRFHKSSHDGSGKCDAYFTANPDDVVHGVVFTIDPEQKPDLDAIEGVGKGYEIKAVQVSTNKGESIAAFSYYATDIDASLSPYCWYLNHVLIGAKQASLPASYIDSKIASIVAIKDPDSNRHIREQKIHKST
ncbi:gamma-glutamylcyclotransferase [Thalassotalea litorea]|uniref:Gamma-glutamylcyclotransferase n=1 Tax=Thalassotalea litorea TaxID=2020715 RepID=A0A5R9IPA8_9GAMM|nr:gamma-glutamylcyclotransferase family protein [Thalassotalea litorea]TLU67112.1 gamma-glutamylcyclotransferase [Thalassotalea litorea]